MAQRVYVPLYRQEIDALVRLAEREDRDPRRQAARLLREALERAGTLPPDDKLTTSPRGPEAA